MHEPSILLVMRLDQMWRVHPNQITMPCSACGETCGVYPSGQNALKKHSNLLVVCNVCHTGTDKQMAYVLTPEHVKEVRESISRKKP